MSPLIALAAVLGLVIVASLIGWRLRATDGRAKRQDGVTTVTPEHLASEASFGERATLVQFSTTWCAKCPGTRRVLDELAGPHDGVTVVDVDLTHRADLADRFSIAQTPTVLVLDARGGVRSRIAGPSRREVLSAELDSVLGRTA